MGARKATRRSRQGEMAPDVPGQRKRKSDASLEAATASKRARVGGCPRKAARVTI